MTKRTLSLAIVAVLLLCGAVWARMTPSFVGQGTPVATPSCADSSCTGFLVCQNYQGTGLDNSESWTPVGSGSVNADVTNPALRGDQSGSVTGGAGSSSQDWYSPAFTPDAPEVWIFLRLQVADATPSNAASFVSGLTAGYAGVFGVGLNTNGKLFESWGYTDSSDTSLSDNTTQYIWIHYKKVAVANDAVLQVWSSTTRTRPGTPGINISNGTATGEINWLVLNSGYSLVRYFDQVLVSTSEIGDVCE